MDRIIIACDFKDKETLFLFLDSFAGVKPTLKIGMELFYKEGPILIKDLKDKGHPIFLDLKLHDIPNTVESAMKNIGLLGVDMVNVHAAGGIDMMKAAKRGLVKAESNALLIAVTQLTSINQETLINELLINKDINEVIVQYALNAKEAGLDGVVCSPLESPVVHKACGDSFLTVTPGIRLEGDSAQDQKRIATPLYAKEQGSDFIVVGRSITASNQPLTIYEKIRKEFL